MTRNNMAVAAQQGVAAIMKMAAARGLHASQLEVEQAWEAVQPAAEHLRLGAVWAWLFPGHSAAPSPLRLMSNSQLPAWVVADGQLGILRRLAEDNQPAEVEWLVAAPDVEPSNWRVTVPVAPLASGPPDLLPPTKRGPAKAAVVEAIKAHAPVFWQAGIASVFINAVAVLSALFAMQVYDRVVPNLALPTLWFLAAGVGVAYVFDLLLKLLRSNLLEASEQRLDQALSQYFFDGIVALKVDRRPAHVGTLVAQVRDYEAVKGFFTASTLFALSELPFIVIFIALIAMIGGPVAWVPTIFVLASVLVGLATYRPVAKRQRLHNEAAVRRQGLLFEAVAGAEAIKGMGAEAEFGDSWLKATRDTTWRNRSLRLIDAAAGHVTQFFQQLGYASIIVVGVYVIAAGEMTLGGLIACSILGGRALAVIAGISKLFLRWHHAKYSLQILDQLLSHPSDAGPDRQANTQCLRLDLRCKDVVYAYAGSTMPQLVLPNLGIDQGERIAVLGRNGSGKSTLLKLLAGIATTSRGQISLAGLDLQQCRPSWLRETVGYLPQDVRLFSGTLLENLTLGLAMPAEAEVHAALEQTGMLPMVLAHPQGLQQPIHEGGGGLSGGQRQLLVLSRLLLQKPSIWLLDEPSASLDSETEARVLTVLKNLPADCTLIFTTHRTHWLDLAKRVLVVDGGQLRMDEPREKIQVNAAATAPANQGGAS